MSRIRSSSLLRPPYAATPGPFGQAAAVESIGSVAAPLLAGFTLTFIGFVLQGRAYVRWPDPALALLVLAALVLVSAVQSAFAARRYYIPPSEWEAWERLAASDREDDLRRQLEVFLEQHRRWLARTRYVYNSGVMLLFLGIAVTLVPPGSIGRWRMAAIVFAALGLVIEAGWTFTGEIHKWSARLRMRRPSAR